MAYNATYTEADLQPAIMNGLTTLVIFVTGFVSIIILFILYKWGSKNVR